MECQGQAESDKHQFLRLSWCICSSKLDLDNGSRLLSAYWPAHIHPMIRNTSICQPLILLHCDGCISELISVPRLMYDNQGDMSLGGQAGLWIAPQPFNLGKRRHRKINLFIKCCGSGLTRWSQFQVDYIASSSATIENTELKFRVQSWRAGWAHSGRESQCQQVHIMIPVHIMSPHNDSSSITLE